MSVFFHGLTGLPWWGLVAVTLALTHITIVSVTVFLHRHQAHRALDLHPLASHFFRFWLWLTTGMITKEWAAVHRKHHARCERADDPHSPQVRGIWTVLFKGTWLYRDACAQREDIEKFGHATPDDWVERRVYTPHNGMGILLMLGVDLLLFGLPGLAVWGVQMIWIPLFAAGVINGIGHYWGYRNFECEDASTNILPWGILIGGEELHNNHHTFGTSAKLSYRWFEFDIGWMYIRLLAMFGLARVRKVAPKLQHGIAVAGFDGERLQAIVANRYSLAARFARDLARACQEELSRVRQALPEVNAAELPAKFRRWLKEERQQTPENERHELQRLLDSSPLVATVYAMRQELSRVWLRSNLTREQLQQELADWCARAEASGIAALARFSLDLRRVALA